MDLHLGADVRQRDGHRFGALHRIVYDPETQQVEFLVVEHAGMDDRDVLVPIGAVQSADNNVIYLELSREQFDSLENFVDHVHNIAPPPDAANVTDDEITDPVDVPDVPAVGAATGVESIAFTPLVEEIVHVPPIDEVIDGDTTVWATDGEIGRVKHVLVSDETDRITALVVEKGFIFHHDIEIPMEWVENIRPETVVLTVDKATVEAAAQGE